MWGIKLRSVHIVFLFWFLFLLSNQLFSNNTQGAASFYVVSAEANFA